MYFNINTGDKTVCVNRDKIAFVEHNKISNTTTVYFSSSLFFQAKGEDVFSRIKKNLEED